MDSHIGKIMVYAQLGVWGDISWKYEHNPLSGFSRRCEDKLDNETKTDGRTEILAVLDITRYAGM